MILKSGASRYKFWEFDNNSHIKIDDQAIRKCKITQF